MCGSSVGDGVRHAAGGQIALDRREQFSGESERGSRRWCGARTMRAGFRPDLASIKVFAQQALDGLRNKRRGASIADGASDAGVLADGSTEAKVVSIGRVCPRA